MLSAFFGASGEIVQVGENDLSQIVKNVCHGTLESGSCVIEAKRHDTICKSSLGGSECDFVLIGWVDLNLVVARETVHERQGLVTGTIIDNLVDKGRWKVVLRTGMMEIMKFRIDLDSALFFVDRDGVGDP
jgi:hypothetical protein